MNSSKQIDKLIAEQSAEWTEVLKRGDARDMAKFAEWSLKSPQHMRQFLMMVALEQELQHIDPQRQFDTPAAEAAADRIVPLRELAKHPAPRAQHWRRWAIAATLLVTVAVPASWYFGSGRATGWQEFSTTRGEQRAVELADGSIMHLNTESRIRVHLSGQEREIRLLSGEAMFKVHHDPARPFRVYASDLIIQAIGTQFNVYRQQSATKISVVEGRVQVTPERAPASTVSNATSANLLLPSKPARLGAGEEAKVGNDGRITRRKSADVTAMAAWRQRRLVFNENPLAEVITEFNRYNRAPKFRIVDAELATRPYSGAFDADDPRSLIELLELDVNLTLENSDDEVLIRRRVQ